MLTFTPRRNGLLRAAPLALIAALGLAACGNSYNGGMTYNMPTGGAPSKLFAADSPHMAVGSLANPNPSAGMIAVDRTIMGPVYTGLLNNIGSLALDPALDYLYVGNGTSIRVFYMASMANGDVPPSRVITNSPAGGNTGSLFLDTLHNRLYVGDDSVGVRVFDNARVINGPTASTRLITGLGTIHGVAVDTGSNDILYVSNTSSAPSNEINLFTASTANGAATPLKTITPTDTGVNLSVGGISLDMANDRLYVAGFTDSTVRVFDAVHNTPGGMIPPTKTLTFPGTTGTISSVTIDSANNRLYAVTLGAIYILNGASTATDPITVTAILVPTNGSFTAVAVNPM